MTMNKASGMTMIGILNCVMGAIGSLMSFMSMSGGSSGSSGSMAMMSGVLMTFGCVGLIIAGVGVLKAQPWGRTLSMGCGAIIALMSIMSLVSHGFGIMPLMMMVYGGALVCLTCMPNYKDIFGCSSCESHSASHSDETSKNMRRAA